MPTATQLQTEIDGLSEVISAIIARKGARRITVNGRTIETADLNEYIKARRDLQKQLAAVERGFGIVQGVAGRQGGA